MISYQKWEYDMFKHHFKRSFSIELDDQNCFPNEKDFVYPNSLVIQAALENYCLKNGIHLEYISKYKPITGWKNKIYCRSTTYPRTILFWIHFDLYRDIRRYRNIKNKGSYHKPLRFIVISFIYRVL